MVSSNPPRPPSREPIFANSQRMNDKEYAALETLIETSALDVFRALERFVDSKGGRLVIVPKQPGRLGPTEGGM